MCTCVDKKGIAGRVREVGYLNHVIICSNRISFSVKLIFSDETQFSFSLIEAFVSDGSTLFKQMNLDLDRKRG